MKFSTFLAGFVTSLLHYSVASVGAWFIWNNAIVDIFDVSKISYGEAFAIVAFMSMSNPTERYKSSNDNDDNQ